MLPAFRGCCLCAKATNPDMLPYFVPEESVSKFLSENVSSKSKLLSPPAADEMSSCIPDAMFSTSISTVTLVETSC